MRHKLFLPVPTKASARTRATCRGRFAQVYTDPGYRKWLEEVVPLLKSERPDLTDEAKSADIMVALEVIIQRPKTTKRVRPGGDNDNYEKGIWDALTKAGWWNDDEQVVENRTLKRWTREGETPGYRLTIDYRI